jgi:hypothetical protein
MTAQVIAWHGPIRFNGEAALDWHGNSHSTTGGECEEEAFVGAGIGGLDRPLA